jgi:hypothetical protein
VAELVRDDRLVNPRGIKVNDVGRRVADGIDVVPTRHMAVATPAGHCVDEGERFRSAAVDREQELGQPGGEIHRDNHWIEILCRNDIPLSPSLQ